jgi:hypothetical protein
VIVGQIVAVPRDPFRGEQRGIPTRETGIDTALIFHAVFVGTIHTLIAIVILAIITDLPRHGAGRKVGAVRIGTVHQIIPVVVTCDLRVRVLARTGWS